MLRDQLLQEFGAAGSDPQELAERLEQWARTTAAAAAVSGMAAGHGAAAAAAAVAAGLLPDALPGLLMLLERLGGLLVEYGAPARKDAAVEMLQRVRAELSTALTATARAPPPGDDDASRMNSRHGGLSHGLSRALRLLHLLMRQLKLDAANARLGALSHKLKGGSAGVDYVRDKFLALHRLPGLSPPGTAASPSTATAEPASVAAGDIPRQVARALPKTWAWVRHSVSAAPAMQGYFSAALGGLDLDAAIAAASASTTRQNNQGSSSAGLIPVELRTGRAFAPPSASSSPAGDIQPSAEVRPRLPARGMRSPEGLVRAGLVALVSGATPAVGPALPEVLALDAERLHVLQNQFQSLVVVAASFLLVTQLRSQYAAAAATAAAAVAHEASTCTDGAPLSTSPSAPAPPPPSAPVSPLPPATPWDHQAAKRRLQILLADPSLQLQHLVTELAATAGLSQLGLPPEAQLQAEGQLRQGLLRVVDPAGPAFRSLSNALAASTLLHMLLGREGAVAVPMPAATGVAEEPAVASPPQVQQQQRVGVDAMVARLLGRVGGGIVAVDVAELAARLLALAGVTEAVHLDTVLGPLSSLAQEQPQ